MKYRIKKNFILGKIFHVSVRRCLSMANLASRHFMQMFANGGKFRKLDLGPKANQGYELSIIERF